MIFTVECHGKSRYYSHGKAVAIVMNKAVIIGMIKDMNKAVIIGMTKTVINVMITVVFI